MNRLRLILKEWRNRFLITGLVYLWGGLSSADFGVQIAATLGAKKIILVGCSATMGDAQARGLSEFYIRDGLKMNPEYQIGQHPHQIRMRQSTARFTEIFKRYGIEVVKHRFDKEKEKYVFMEIKSEREDLWNTGYARWVPGAKV